MSTESPNDRPSDEELVDRPTSLQVAELTGHVVALAEDADRLQAELARVRGRRRTDLRWVAGAVVVLAGFGVHLRMVQTQHNQTRREQHAQTLALTVGVCALQNTVRIEMGNLLARAQNERIFELTGVLGDSPEVQAENERRRVFLRSEQDRFATVPCESLVAGEKVEIRLRYPPTIPVTVP